MFRQNQLIKCRKILNPLYTVFVGRTFRPFHNTLLFLFFSNVEHIFKIFMSIFCHPLRDRTTCFFNHRQMFNFIMRWEKQRTIVQLNQNATNWPNITLIIPWTTLQCNFRPSILSCVNDSSSFIILIIETWSSSKINKHDIKLRRVFKRSIFVFSRNILSSWVFVNPGIISKLNWKQIVLVQNKYWV